MMHGQADDLVSNLGGDGQVIRRSTGEATIGGELADKRVEIPAAEDPLIAHLEIELIAGHAIFRGINEDGEVAIVMADTGHIVKETNTGDVA